METRFKHGQKHPEIAGLVFWSYRPKGNLYWVTKEQFDYKRDLSNSNRAEWRNQPHVKKQELEFSRRYRKTDAAKIANYKYRASHPDKVKEWQSTQEKKTKSPEGRAKRNAYMKKYNSIPANRICEYAKTRINAMLRGRIKHGRTKELIGCTREEFMAHIEKQFTAGMNWNCRGHRGIHLDHILPLAMFDLNRADHQEIAFNYRNYRPVWWNVNLSKKDKIDLSLIEKHGLTATYKKLIQ